MLGHAHVHLRVCAHAGWRIMSSNVLRNPPHLETGSVIGLELTNQARLEPLPSCCWDLNWMSLVRHLYTFVFVFAL